MENNNTGFRAKIQKIWWCFKWYGHAKYRSIYYMGIDHCNFSSDRMASECTYCKID